MNNQMNNPMGILNGFQNFMQNPLQFMAQKNIPQEFANDPNGAIQYLMNSGRISQAQYNQAKQIADQLRNNPMFGKMFNK